MVAALVSVAALSCPPPSSASRLPLVRSGRPLSGDVDGDGRPDRVSVRYAPSALNSCAFFLVLRRAHGSATAPLPFRGGGIGLAARDVPAQDAPRLVGLWRLDGGTRLEIVVQVSHGAADAFLAVYRVRSGRIVRIRAPDLDGTFAFGGSVMSYTNVLDCTRDGRVVYGRVRVVSPARAFATGAVLRLAGDHFVTERRTSRTIHDLRSLPPAAGLFAHCRGVVGIPNP